MIEGTIWGNVYWCKPNVFSTTLFRVGRDTLTVFRLSWCVCGWPHLIIIHLFWLLYFKFIHNTIFRPLRDPLKLLETPKLAFKLDSKVKNSYTPLQKKHDVTPHSILKVCQKRKSHRRQQRSNHSSYSLRFRWPRFICMHSSFSFNSLVTNLSSILVSLF